MALPVFLTELNILCVREEGTRITIGPKGELAGFRQTDFLRELRTVRHWLRHQTGIEEVLIDVENRQYLRGRTLAGLVLLREDVPEGAEFGIVGESELLDSVLDKMNASDAVPVFPDQASAFDHTPPSRLQLFAARSRSRLDRFRMPLILGGIAFAVLAGAGVLLLSDPVPADYGSLMSTWQRALQLRQSRTTFMEVEEQLADLRLQIDDLVVRYVEKSSPHEDEAHLLEAARALSANLRSVTRHHDSEQRFLRSMQRVAAIHAIDELPPPTSSSDAISESDSASAE